MAANLTARETEILVAYVKESKADVDWSKVAAAANCTTAKYARDKFASIRNKIIAAAGTKSANNGDTTAAAATPSTKPKAKGGATAKATATGKKRKNVNADGDDEESETPAKKRRAQGSKAKSVPSDGNESATDSVIKEEEVDEEPNEAGEMLDALND